MNGVHQPGIQPHGAFKPGEPVPADASDPKAGIARLRKALDEAPTTPIRGPEPKPLPDEPPQASDSDRQAKLEKIKTETLARIAELDTKKPPTDEA